MATYDDQIWQLVPEEPGLPPDWLTRFVSRLDPARRALDLGCGDGRVGAALRARSLVAADVSGVALERAARRLPDAEIVQLELDAPLPFADGDFDLVLCAETIEHVRDVQLLLSETRRVLAPGGLLALTTPAQFAWMRSPDPFSPHVRFFTRRSLTRVLRDMGFDVLTLRRKGGNLLVTATR